VPIQRDRVPGIEDAAVEWFGALAEVIGPAFENRVTTVASASPVTAALGAMGHELVEMSDLPARDRLCRRLTERLRAVCWEKGKVWEGIAGKFTPKGNFSTSGAKDAAYAVYGALVDENSPGYRQIRPARSEDELSDAPKPQRATGYESADQAEAVASV
jgi:DNA sulfur modification protein DndB